MSASDAFHFPLHLWPFLTRFLCVVSSGFVHMFGYASQYVLLTVAHVCLHLPDTWHQRAPHFVLNCTAYHELI